MKHEFKRRARSVLLGGVFMDLAGTFGPDGIHATEKPD